MRRLHSTSVRLALAALATAGPAVLLSNSDLPQFTIRDKAFYADASLVNFVRPGLAMKVTGAEITVDGTIRVRFTITDTKGLPLDRLGVVTPGEVRLSFIAATIPKGETQYRAYTTRAVTSPITNNTATQASTDSGGTYETLGEGAYQYTFATKAPADYDRTATHSIGMTATRDLTEFDLGSQYANDVFTFVPDGSKVQTVRDIVRVETCNAHCHDPLAMHGGSRRDTRLCILCHTPQSSDPDTGNTIDFPVLIHKIHMGANLPSVKAGKPFQIIGNRQRVFDFSEVEFPADPRNCQMCHDAQSGAAQADAYLKPNRSACGACHDDVNFATGANHFDIPEVSDSQCGRCHIPEGEMEYDASILGAHRMERFSRDLPGTVFEIAGIENGAAGKRPTVAFTVKDKAGNLIPLSEMTSLGLVLAGPTSDYALFFREDGRRAKEAGGQYFYTFQNAIPADSKGSFSVSIEGYRTVKLLANTLAERTVRDAGDNKVKYFSIDGSPVEQRRQVVAIEKCNACHYSLSMHGNNRNRVEHCVQCHNANQTDEARRPAYQMPAVTINFRHLIHRIHTGEDAETEYTVFGFGGRPFDTTKIIFPGDRRNCNKCHVNDSQQLPLKDNLLEVKNPRGLLNPMGPTAAACTGCHTDIATASHALAMTNKVGESCAVCHGPSAEFSVNRMHAR